MFNVIPDNVAGKKSILSIIDRIGLEPINTVYEQGL